MDASPTTTDWSRYTQLCPTPGTFPSGMTEKNLYVLGRNIYMPKINFWSNNFKIMHLIRRWKGLKWWKEDIGLWEECLFQCNICSLPHDYNLYLPFLLFLCRFIAQYQVPITLHSFLPSLSSALGCFSC